MTMGDVPMSMSPVYVNKAQIILLFAHLFVSLQSKTFIYETYSVSDSGDLFAVD